MGLIYTVFTLAILSTAPAAAQTTAIALPQVHTSGSIGLTSADSVRWNVLNPPMPAPIVAPTCNVTLSFLNGPGNVLKTETVTLKAGESRSLTLSAADFPSGGNPTGIYALAVVPVTGPTDQPTPTGTCTIVTTAEIIETATGKTLAVSNGTQVRPGGLQPADPPVILPAPR
jgi:hypothetical protein